MSCPLCHQEKNNLLKPIAELDGITLSHILPSDDGFAMKGRLLIRPSRHATRPEELTPDEFSKMGILLQKAMALLQQRLGAEHVYFFRINDLVAHFHFHVVPRYPGTPKEFWGLKIIDWPDYPKVNLSEIQVLTTTLK
jgi:histidine triad (HIT) family protein